MRADASRGPLLLGVEDLHWADPSTLLALRDVLHDRDPAVLLVVTRRRHPATKASAEGTAETTASTLPPTLHGAIVRQVASLGRDAFAVVRVAVRAALTDACG